MTRQHVILVQGLLFYFHSYVVVVAVFVIVVIVVVVGRIVVVVIFVFPFFLSMIPGSKWLENLLLKKWGFKTEAPERTKTAHCLSLSSPFFLYLFLSLSLSLPFSLCLFPYLSLFLCILP